MACAKEAGLDIRRIQKQLGHVRLDTTTIYIRAASPRNEVEQTSPLDTLWSPRDPASRNTSDSTIATTQSSKPPSVGKLRIHMQAQAKTEESDRREAKVTLGITTDDGPVIYLTGILATEARPSWITLNVPPLEHWEESLRWLPRAQQRRIEEPSFFEMLQREIPRRFEQLTFP